MRPFRLLLLYLVIVFVGGALVAPWLYALVQWGGEHSPAFEKLARNPFHRFVHRSFLVLALAFLWPLFRRLGLRSWKDFGFANPLRNGPAVLGGLLLGLVSLSCVALCAVLLHARQFNVDLAAPAVFKMCWTAGLAALLVGLLEETLFRGAIFGALRKTNPWRLAMVISSAIYAILHFFSNPTWSGEVKWYSGLVLLPKMFAGFANFEALVPGFFTLLLVGMILALAYQRSGNLYFSIGLHAGWIFCLKSYRFFTHEVPGANPWIFGSDKIIDGWLALPILVLVFLIISKKWPSSEH